ncbi:inositol monophosphatase family protein [Pseudomonas baetica]|nr:inositol monophosphatase family protein [Pseudomonas baetica]
MPSPDLSELLAQVTEIVVRAGTLLAEEWSRPDGPRGLGDKAVIDVEIERVLRPELLSLLKCDFWGEETGHVLTGHAWCWVVDPNDGTSDFLKGLKGSAISVGLLYNTIPVIGVVYAPVTAFTGSVFGQRQHAWTADVEKPARGGLFDKALDTKKSSGINALLRQ